MAFSISGAEIHFFLTEDTAIERVVPCPRQERELLYGSLRASIGLLRRLLSIVLTAVFFLPILSPLLALGQPGDAGLPACCRRNGKHHCMMSMEERARAGAATERAPRWQAPVEKCPCCPAVPVAVHPDRLAPPRNATLFAGVAGYAAVAAQAERAAHIARDRSRQKRGPPLNA